MSSSYVVIDSRHGSGSTSAKFEYRLSKPINKVKAIELLSANIPTAPTVISNWNDLVYFFAAGDGSGSTLLSATLTEGYYTPDEFINMLNTVMTAAATSATFTSTYDANTNKFTLIADENVRLAAASQISVSAGDLNYERWGRFGYLIGQDSSTVQTAATSIELTYEWQPKSVRYYTVLIEANGFGNNDMINDKSYFSFCIPTTNDELFGFERFRRNSGFEQISKINNVNVQEITVSTYFEDDLKQLFSFAGKDIEYIVKVYT